MSDEKSTKKLDSTSFIVFFVTLAVLENFLKLLLSGGITLKIFSISSSLLVTWLFRYQFKKYNSYYAYGIWALILFIFFFGGIYVTVNIHP